MREPSPSLQLSLHEYSCLRTELLWIYDHAPLHPRQTVNRSRDDGNWVWFLRSGKLTLATPEKTLRVRPGQWVMLPEGVATHQFSPDARLLSIRFRCQWPSGKNLLRAERAICFEDSSCPELERRAARLERYRRRQFPEGLSHHAHQWQVLEYGRYVHLHGLFLSWWEPWVKTSIDHGAEWSRLRTGDDRALRAARRLNEAPLAEGFPRVLLEEETGLSLVHLNRLFFQEFGLTTRKYWERRLLQMARDSLLDVTLPVKELAYRLGFRSDSLFVNWFRRLTGVSPGQYRLEIGR